MEEIKIWLGGDSGIKEPKDIDGNIISVGDLLTRDYGEDIKNGIEVDEKRTTESFYKVKMNDRGGYYAESIEPIGDIVIGGDDKYYYLHDFRFKFCKVIPREK